MKEKKVNLSTFLLIISLIVIACMVYYIYHLKTNTPNTDSQISNDLTNEIDFSEEEIKKALTNYLNIFYGSGSQEGLLVSLEFFDYLETNNFESFEVKGEDGYNILYKKTNIKYSDFMDVIKEYLSEELFEKNNYNAKEGFLKFIEDDGLLCYASYGASGMEYGVDSITLKDDNSDLTYIAKIYEIPINPDFPEVYEEIEFSIESYNGKCVISDIKDKTVINNIELGKYVITGMSVEPDYNYGIASIVLEENNSCTIYDPYNLFYECTYEIKDNILICKSVKEIISGDPTYEDLSKEVEIIFEFEILENNNLKFISVSDDLWDTTLNMKYVKEGE